MFMAVLSQFCGDLRMRKQETDLVRGAFDGMSKKAGMFVDDLRWNTADGGSHDRLLFPKRFRDGKPETLAKALLNDHSGSALESVYFQGSPCREFKDLDVRIVIRFAHHFLEDNGAFGVVRSAAARENQLAIEVALHDSISADDADRILQAVEARNLSQYRAHRVNLIAPESFLDKVRVEGAVFLGERIDGRVEKILRDGELPGKLWRRKHCTVIAGDKFLEEFPNGKIGMR